MAVGASGPVGTIGSAVSTLWVSLLLVGGMIVLIARAVVRSDLQPATEPLESDRADQPDTDDISDAPGDDAGIESPTEVDPDEGTNVDPSAPESLPAAVAPPRWYELAPSGGRVYTPWWRRLLSFVELVVIIAVLAALSAGVVAAVALVVRFVIENAVS